MRMVGKYPRTIHKLHLFIHFLTLKSYAKSTRFRQNCWRGNA